jgi:hypothetical protein
MLSANEILYLEKRLEEYNKKRCIKKIKNIEKKINKKFLIVAFGVVFIGVFSFVIYDRTKTNQPKNEIVDLKDKIQDASKYYEHQPLYSSNSEEIYEQNTSQTTPQGWLYFNEISNLKDNKDEEIKSPKEINEDQSNELQIQDITDNELSEKKPKIELQINSINLSVDELEKKFEENKDAKIATSIAKKYFDKKKYKQSEKWSLIANELDSSNEESWIIFARSKFRQNSKKEAIKILQTYNENANSKIVDEWIEKMKK